MKFDRLSRYALLGMVALAALLSGCTSYVTSQVTAFSDWHGGTDATRTYAFTHSPQQQNNLEQATYERAVGNELASQAFRQVSASDAHYYVALWYGTHSQNVTVAQPAFMGPWPGPYWGRPLDPWGPWGPWGAYPPAYVSETYPVFTHALNVRITERATGKEVYNVTARTTTDDGSLVDVMPFLARSALAQFPLGNGVVTTVKLPVGKNGGIASNETAAATSAPAAASAPKPAQ